MATAFLVGHRGTRRSLEAAWKYVVLGSVGVAIAFLGVVLLYAAGRSAGEATLSWTDLVSGRLAARPRSGPVAVALAVLGLRDQGRTGAHALLAARRARPGPGAGLRADVRRAAVGRVLRASCGSRRSPTSCSGPGLMRGLLVTAGLAVPRRGGAP